MMLRALGDPNVVAKFQHLCGLREIWAKEDDFQPVCSGIESQRNGRVSPSNRFSPHSSHVHTMPTDQDHANGFVEHESTKKSQFCGDEKENQLYEFNSFFHALFWFGSSLGYEIFYTTFFPFLFWNIDEYLVRRTVLMWALIMYLGQASKDVIQWPRPPSPPVIPVEKRFAAEYGMPSTHAMVGTLIPVCLVYFTYGRYQYPLYAGVLFVLCWSILVSTSRLYMGMHTLQDLLVGVVFSLFLLVTLLPHLDDKTENWVLNSPYSPIFVILVGIVMIRLYPSPPSETQTRSDTAMIVFGTCGGLIGCWGRCYFQGIPDPYLGAPFPLRIPGSKEIIQMLLKFVFGLTVIIPTRSVMKCMVYSVVPWLLAETDPKKKKALCEMPHRFFTYLMLGITAFGLVPLMFAYMEM
ncbi:sphingosine-1-phosphate phosphatase 2-like [Montipora foliosa]|uniref:sphingosine-1-phosphate phosphatase 2-like n=1 Tax=Montipora foliosa TaxID=591990 RepID=UPI0035F19FC6